MNNHSIVVYSESKAELSNPSKPIKKHKITRDGMSKILMTETTSLEMPGSKKLAMPRRWVQVISC